jgi:hypothetical protein
MNNHITNESGIIEDNLEYRIDKAVLKWLANDASLSTSYGLSPEEVDKLIDRILDAVRQ